MSSDTSAPCACKGREFINSPANLWYAAPRDFEPGCRPGRILAAGAQEVSHGPAR